MLKDLTYWLSLVLFLVNSGEPKIIMVSGILSGF